MDPLPIIYTRRTIRVNERLASTKDSSTIRQMSCDKFDPKCSGCRPAILDPQTQKILSADHPVMKVMNEVWDASPFEEQEAYWRVMVKNSRDPNDLLLTGNLTDRFGSKIQSN